MNVKLFSTTLIACCLITASQAQNATNEKEAKGKAIVQVFGNFHSGFGSENHNRGFELDRSYLGYEYKTGKGISIKGVMDIGKSSDVSDYQRIAYIKNAMITWEHKKLSVSGGLISTTQFNLQEKAWGYRYIMKSFQDQHKFGSSADLGLSASYKFCEWLSADAIIVNGEGYKKIQVDRGLNYGLGITVTPVKGFTARVYGGINECSKDEQKNTANLAIFAGYKNKSFSAGAEYNYIKNANYTEDFDKYGYSMYASGKVSEKIDVYGRLDKLYSDSYSENETSLLLGLQIKLGSYVKVAPNFRMNIPKADESSGKYMAYVSCCFGL